MVYDSFKQVIMRVMVEIQSPLRLFITSPSGQPVQVDNHDYNWKHLAVFETQMVEPPKFKSYYKLENYQEWLMKFKFGESFTIIYST